MSDPTTKTNAMTQHLAPNRRLILARSLLAGAAGLVPVPYLDDLMAGAVRSALIRRLAELRAVDVDGNAVAELATPRGNRLLNAAGLGALAVGGARRAWRRVATSIVFVRRVDEAMQTFQVGTLFDHYCARHHVGFGLDGDKASRLRGAMDQAIRAARNDTLERAFRRTLRASSGVIAGAARLLPRRGRRLEDPGDVPQLEGPLEKFEQELSGPATAYVAALVGAFDVAWAPHKQAQLESHK
jgi:uncharacterized protein (DUF697 family)